MTPRISVILPCYNIEDLLPATLDTVLAQTLPPLEIIAVDDGATDGTAAVIDAYAARDPRVRRISQKNGGISKARNRGASEAKGDWFAWLDGDDLWAPDKLQRQFAEWDGKAALLYTDRRNFGDRGDLPEIASDGYAMHSGDVFEKLLLESNFICVSSVVQRRETFEEIGGFSHGDDLLVCEDWDMWLQVTARGHTVQCCHAPLTEYRLRAGGTSRVPERMTTTRLKVIERALATPRGQALPAALRRRVLAETLRTNAWDLHRHGRRSEAIKTAWKAVFEWPFAKANLRELARVTLRAE